MTVLLLFMSKIFTKKPMPKLRIIGLGITLTLLLLYILLGKVAHSQEEGAGSYYDLAQGETLEEVGLRFGLNVRTLSCANPQWEPSSRRIFLPLSSARRYQVASGETLGEIARLYGVTTEMISQYPLNFWNGCQGVAAFEGTNQTAGLPAGTLLYIPDELDPLTSRQIKPWVSSDNGPDLKGRTDDYSNQEEATTALINPNPLPFLPTSTPTAVNKTTIKASTSPTASAKTQAASSTTLASSTPNIPKPSIAEKPASSSTPTSLPSKPVAAAGKPIIWPIRGVITTYFSSVHPAIDIATTAGTPILAAQSGTVFYAAWSPYGYGNFVQIDHGDGRHTHYAHFSSFVVKTGQVVSQGQLLGYEGSTGNSTGPHLHFELVISGRYVDPLLYLPR